MVKPLPVDKAPEALEIEHKPEETDTSINSSSENAGSEKPLEPENYYQHSPPPPVPQMMYRQPQDPVKEIFRMVKAMLWSTAFISYLVILVLSFIIVLAMTPEIQEWITTPSVPSADDPSVLLLPEGFFFLIFPVPMLLFKFSGAGFQAWHIIMLSILIMAFTYGKYELIKDWLSRKNQALLSLTTPEKAKSSLEGVAKLFMASSFFSMVYFVFLALTSVEMSTPDFDSFSRPELIYGLFNAAVFEELVSRLLLIGVPLVIIGIIKKWNNPLRKLIGGGLDINYMTMGLITFSAIFFALAHVGGWDFWKVPQVLVTGFALGYAFVRYGLHASILVHFSINLTTSALEVWPDNLFIGSLLGMAYFIWIVIGCYFFFDYIWRLLKKLGAIQKPMPAQQMPPSQYGYPPQYQGQPPPQSGQQYQGSQYPQSGPSQNNYQPPPGQPNYAHPPNMPKPKGFMCPNCGNTGAIYAEGQLTCMRCSTKFGDSKPADPENDTNEMYAF